MSTSTTGSPSSAAPPARETRPARPPLEERPSSSSSSSSSSSAAASASGRRARAAPRPPLREVGFWAVDDADPRPRPQDCVAAPGVTEAAAVVAYLRGGWVESHELGYSHCRFGCFAGAPARAMGCCSLTDGVFVWPEGLAHYVEEHGVRVDAALEQRARERAPCRPPGGAVMVWDGSRAVAATAAQEEALRAWSGLFCPQSACPSPSPSPSPESDGWPCALL